MKWTASYDLFAATRRRTAQLAAIIRRAGETPRVGNVNKRSGAWRSCAPQEPCARRRLDYDAGGGHGHLDGLNLGLFAKGWTCCRLRLLPVQYGGGGRRAPINLPDRLHNTVVVDGASQQAGRVRRRCGPGAANCAPSGPQRRR